MTEGATGGDGWVRLASLAMHEAAELAAGPLSDQAVTSLQRETHASKSDGFLAVGRRAVIALASLTAGEVGVLHATNSRRQLVQSQAEAMAAKAEAQAWFDAQVAEAKRGAGKGKAPEEDAKISAQSVTAWHRDTKHAVASHIMREVSVTHAALVDCSRGDVITGMFASVVPRTGAAPGFRMVTGGSSAWRA